MSPERSALLLAGLMASAGLAHFAAPKQFDAIVPRSLPGSPRAWTTASGVAELALAAGLAIPATRKASAQATALFLAGVFPANVKMAYDWRHRSRAARAVACARLPLQVPLILWARHAGRQDVRRGAEGAGG
ncbi:DoxX family protein [Streptomyces showdoensis]|uniref:Membrane protein n=1 Tax=Streptomyces showdoensis TaxID=68268 RepID=A0A2P2GNT5_STREW|nr:DoxX family protein [Streptomyces showdoensis]KKZ72555.1 membrane protein [Streptomyces showdoensis]